MALIEVAPCVFCTLEDQVEICTTAYKQGFRDSASPFYSEADCPYTREASETLEWESYQLGRSLFQDYISGRCIVTCHHGEKFIQQDV